MIEQMYLPVIKLSHLLSMSLQMVVFGEKIVTLPHATQLAGTEVDVYGVSSCTASNAGLVRA